MNLPNRYRCLQTIETPTGPNTQLVSLPLSELTSGEVLIRVHYSSLNYKDGLATQAHRGVIKSLPHTPGIDAAGVILECNSSRFTVGQEVIVTGYELGQSHWGGWSEYIRVPIDWIVPLPAPLTLRQSMVLGTAGFTAAQCVLALQRAGLSSEHGPIVVSGASGGVGCWAVSMLSHLGFQVTAATGKKEANDLLLACGATRVIDRQELVESSRRPMLSARWAGAVDTVGGQILNTILRSTKYGGCVAACGLTAGSDLNMTVFPFILRGVQLAGVASADCPYAHRLEIWQTISSTLLTSLPADMVTEVALEQLLDRVADILAGKISGRVVVRVA
ncbi:MAG: acryloyl-CoA reductase [Planctomycetales bacterium]|nr:acryloyl-CoA reductase [Planctomycetales bacterium]